MYIGECCEIVIQKINGAVMRIVNYLLILDSDEEDIIKYLRHKWSIIYI